MILLSQDPTDDRYARVSVHSTTGTEDDADDPADESADENEAPVGDITQDTETPEEFETDEKDARPHSEDDDPEHEDADDD